MLSKGYGEENKVDRSAQNPACVCVKRYGECRENGGLMEGWTEPADVEGSPGSEKVPEGPAPNGTPVGSSALGVDGDSAHPADTEEGERAEEESPVMNFFKTLVTPSKTPKQEGAPPAVPVDEAKGSGEPEEVAKAETSPVAQPAGAAPAEPKAPDPPVKESGGSPFSKLFRSKPKDAKPASAAKVAQEVDATAPKPPPPPPPPEPPKLEGRAEAAAKIANSTPKDAAKETEAAAKQKASKGSPFSKLFHAKKEEEEEVAKVEEPQPASQEEEVAEVGLRAADAPGAPGQSPKPEKKSGKASLASLFKPKVLQRLQASTIQAAAVFGYSVPSSSAAATADTKAKEGPSPAVTVVTVETTQSVQVKAEPKPAAEVERKRQEGPAADGKSVSEASQTGEDSGRSFTKRLEKRNSIHAFFKNLGPKRQSDVGVQTDPVTITYPAK
ncbi:hypothetical protein AGOR_G00079770 [Albula goreensis]|uniref:Breast carcinoma-amplified sequence 1 n=1 Tax=Albula goreensis TaxID=1534307 RepID=A0A8T3DKS3_9TELE|nr:hypothetical protein AGOR_G00079770 [Albula goreensis]